MDYCQEAVDTADLDNSILQDFNPEINISINVNGTNVSNHAIVNNIINHLKKHALKSKSKSKQKSKVESIVDHDICEIDLSYENTADDSGFPDTSYSENEQHSLVQNETETDSIIAYTDSNAETQQPETGIV